MISFAEYRKRWQGHFAKVSGWHDERTMSYPRSLAVTWNTTVPREPWNCGYPVEVKGGKWVFDTQKYCL